MKDNERIKALFDIRVEKLLLNYIAKKEKRGFEEIFSISTLEQEGKDYYKYLESVLMDETRFSNFTLNEIDAFLHYYNNEKEDRYTFYDVLFQIAKDYIVFTPEPHVKQGKIIEWRKIIQQFGEDIFICSGLINKGDEVASNSFSWPSIISSNDTRLQAIMQKGVSENHSHLLGAAPIPDLNWCALHNEDAYLSNLKEKDFRNTHSPCDDFNLFKLRMFRAKIIRKYFYYLITGAGVNEKAYIKLLLCKSVDEIRILSALYPSFETNQFFSNDKVLLDYAMKLMNTKNPIESERSFLYTVLKKYPSLNKIEKASFYLYLIYKMYFYNQFVQKRDLPGFKHFMRYERYKEAFLEDSDKYKDLMIESAITSSCCCQMDNLEVRVKPKKTYKRDLEYIHRIMVGSLKAKYKMNTNRCYRGFWYKRFYFGNPNALMVEKLKNVFVVFHFIKNGIEPIESKIKGFCNKRNHKTRKEIKDETLALVEFLSKSSIYSRFIFGIDAANQEIGCRPEVFSQVFRYLRDVEYKDIFTKQIHRALKGITYHVGEDFIDIIDGLRAIYEAIIFLNLQSGDRLGHAIALGVNAQEYYDLKEKCLYKTKQDLLDDYIFLYFALNKMGTHVSLKAKVYYEIQQLIRELYSETIPMGHCPYEDQLISFTLSDYYDSMKLRGDDPELYKEYYLSKEKAHMSIEDFARKEWFRDKYTKYALNSNRRAVVARKNKNAIKLYYMYHFCVETRKRGEKKKEIKVDNDYIEAVQELQEYMKKEYIIPKRLVVEVNLTSNYLIGSYRGYKFSTLLSLNRYILDSSFQNNVQVCINTDDSGVFASNLYTEYSLLLELLTNQENLLDETKKYDVETVYQYLDYLRESSNTFSFANHSEIEDYFKRLIQAIRVI